jgi:hypothetical protein
LRRLKGFKCLHLNGYSAVLLLFFVILLGDVCYYGFCVSQSAGRSEDASALPSTSSESPLPSGSSSTSSESPSNFESPSPSESSLPSESPSTSQPMQSSVTSGSPIIVTTSTKSNSTQIASDIKLGIYGNDPSKSPAQGVQAINWSANGPLAPGQNMSSTKVYLRNEGNMPVVLGLSASNWAFQDSVGGSLSQSYQQYFALTWDYDNSKIAVDEIRSVVFTLTISPSIVNVKEFSFSIVVTAS